MTKKKIHTESPAPQWDMKTSKESSDECQKNYYYDYYTYNNHYCKEEIKKEAIFTISSRGKRIIQTVAEISLGIAIGLVAYAIFSTAIAVKNIEKVLDKKATPVHTVSSTTNSQTK
jgi:hypothetical protein